MVSILSTRGPKNPKNGKKNFKSLFRDLTLCLNQIEHEESENRDPKALGLYHEGSSTINPNKSLNMVS